MGQGHGWPPRSRRISSPGSVTTNEGAHEPRIQDPRMPRIESLASQHAALATSVALRYRHRAELAGIDWDELFQIAQLGLAQAARTYDPARGTKFTTIAWRRVEGSIKT